MFNEGRPDPKLVARTIKDARLGRTFGSVMDARGDARATGAEQQFRLQETARTKSGSSVKVARVSRESAESAHASAELTGILRKHS
jgi:hypothetical protein